VAARTFARYRAGMLRTSLGVVFALGLALVGCKGGGKAEPSSPTPITAGTFGPDGVRRIAVDAGKKGYQPERIGGKPGEKLVLVFTRTDDAACIAQLKTPDGKLVDLPKGTPVEVAVTVPASGEVGFACGMDMFHGAIVAAKS
jgi:plastocyanin domain-containing protein